MFVSFYLFNLIFPLPNKLPLWSIALHLLPCRQNFSPFTHITGFPGRIVLPHWEKKSQERIEKM